MKRFFLLLSALVMPFAAAAADRLLLTGGSELFLVEPDATGKTWSWRATERPELPDNLKNAFASGTDCKPLDGGRKILYASSSGGCALLERDGGKALWWARVRNAHSIESLPGGRIVVASSVGGDRLVLFDASGGDRELWSGPLPSAHGVVWDPARGLLYALGFKELQSYELENWDGAEPALKLKDRHPLPDPDGHDLSPVPGGADLVVTTGRDVWLFDRDQGAFRPHPDFSGRKDVKCVAVHPENGRTLVIQATGKNWWTETAELFRPDARMLFKGEILYKGRWLAAGDGTPAAAPPEEGLRVLSYNIRHGSGMDGKLNLARTAKVINDRQPDLVLLQEVDKTCTRSGKVDQAAELGRLTGMHAVFGAAIPLQGGEYGQAILSRTPLGNTRIHRLPGPGEARICLAADVETRIGGLTVATVHLDFGKARDAQAAALAEALAGEGALILGGDFNAGPGSATMNRFTREPWIPVPKTAPAASFPADHPRDEIDHFVLRGLRHLAPATVENEPAASDHRPIMVVVGKEAGK